MFFEEFPEQSGTGKQHDLRTEFVSRPNRVESQNGIQKNS